MASNTVRVNVIGDSSQLRTAFDQGADAGDRFKAKMGLLAKAVVAALAVKALKAVKDFVGDSVRAYSDLNESLNAVEVTYGRNAEAIKKLGEQSAQSVGLSNAEFNSFAVSMAAFAEQIAGPGGDVVGVVDDMMTRVADFASVMNLDVSEAFEKFQSGLAGQSRPLREFGIDVSAARVEQFALANGIGEVGRELTESEKVMARYGVIMEQTEKTAGDFQNTIDNYANAQRVANAEMENSKARIGELLVPVAQLTTQLKLGLAQGLSLLSSNIQTLTGDLSEAQNHIAKFEAHMGISADTAEAALTILVRYGTAVEELIPQLGLSRDELIKLRDADEDLLKSLGLTEDQVGDLADVVGRELASALTEGEQATRDFYNATELSTAATEADIEAKEKQREALRGLHNPMGRLITLAGEQTTAQDALNEAVDEYGANSDEATDAALNLAGINSEMIGIMEKLKEDGIDPTGLAARNMFRDLGIPEETINAIFAQYDRIAAGLPVLNFQANVPAFRFNQSGNAIEPFPTGRRAMQHGGIATGPTDARIGEAGFDEAVIPLNNQGIKILGAALREAMNGSNGNGRGGAVYITVNALDPQSAANAVVQALQTYERGNGAIPISTR